MKCMCIDEMETICELDKTDSKNRRSFTSNESEFESLAEANKQLLEGKILFELGEYADAITFINKSLEITNNNDDLYNLMGASFHKIGMTEEAEKAYLKAITINENNFKPYYNIANLYLDLKCYEKSIHYFLKSGQRNAVDSDVHISLALAYREDKQLDNAIKSCLIAITQDSKNFLGYYNLGVIYQEIGEVNEAIRHYELALKIDKFHINSLFNLASSYLERGLNETSKNRLNDLNQALDCYLRILNTDDTDSEVHKGIRQVKRAIHKYDQKLSINVQF